MAKQAPKRWGLSIKTLRRNQRSALKMTGSGQGKAGKMPIRFAVSL